ncbi:head GIN domain-containing protein [Mucilaginibacter sp.]|uniref:head GIN domain-containing protein n=1 Tax=Mucilaginibacter sp. TaxID=1882438 RepID=UPI003D132013
MKSITKFLLAALLLAGTGYTFAKPAPAVKISIRETVDRHLSGFNAINVAGPFDVFITQGAVESVKVEAPADVIDRVMTDVNGGVLKVYSKHDTFSWGNWFGNHKKIAIYVTAKDLNNISITGSGDVRFRDGITVGAIKLRISGSGDMSGKITAKSIESSITGSGDMTLSGHAESSIVSVVGSGDYSGGNLTTLSTAIRVSGSGDAYVNASEKLDAAVNGSGDIHYTGSPKNVSKAKSGSGDIHGN